MWYYVTDKADLRIVEAAKRNAEELTVQKDLPEQAEILFLDRRDIPYSVVKDACIGIDRPEPGEIAGWVYEAQQPYDAEQLVRVAQSLCGRRQADTVRLLTESCLTALSMPKHLLGFRYTCSAVELLHSAPQTKRVSMMKDVYPYLAETYQSTPVMTSRAIRHAIDRAWRDGDRAVQRSYFGYSASDTRGTPTNVEFLYAVSERVRLLEHREPSFRAIR